MFERFGTVNRQSELRIIYANSLHQTHKFHQKLFGNFQVFTLTVWFWNIIFHDYCTDGVHGWFLDEFYKFSIAPRNKGGVF